MNVEDLTVFILSHKSPNKCETLDALIKCNYKGKWYILIDDEDDFINEYKVKYGDNLVIYHKEDYKRNVDLGYSVMNLASYAHSIFARNALEDIAKSMGLKHYIVSDDDVYDFKYRIPDYKDKKLAYYSCNDITIPLKLYCELMMENNIACLGVGTPNVYIGGFNKISEGGHYKRRCVSNFYMRNMSFDIDWVGSIDDFTTSIVNGSKGNLFLTLSPLAVCIRPQYTQKGKKREDNGMADFYKNSDLFQRSYICYMTSPSFITINTWKGNYIPFIKSENAYPKIIKDKYRSV